MKLTSAEANKLLKKKNDEYAAILAKEERSRTFLAAMGEDVDSVRPEYDYEETRNALENICRDIRVLKHAINVFNTTHTVGDFGMTVDEMLVYIPQLTRCKDKLFAMKARLPKERVEEYSLSSRTHSFIDYSYVNYDLKQVEVDYEKVSDTLSRAQIALDITNNTETLDVEF